VGVTRWFYTKAKRSLRIVTESLAILGDMSDYPTFPPPSSPPTFAAPLPPKRGRRGFAAGVIAASLLVGGGAGIGGAAVYSALDDGGGTNGNGSTASTSTPVSTSTDTKAPEGSVEQVAAAVLPSVVKLDVSGAQGEGSGSGIILTEDGQILTNDHVASLAGEGGEITVSFADGTKATATVLGTDPLTDTAVIQAQDVSGLTPITVGQSSNLDVGEEVVAIGSPFGLDSTVTSGIVSALNRPVNVGSDGQGNSTVYPAIQTDAAINPGNSGGPLVDMSGKLVGINASIRASSTSLGEESGSIGLGFAIPIDEVLPVIDQMKNGETPTHARLGITVGDAGAGSGATGAEITEGAQIQDITADSAAGSAGLESGDVITKIDDIHITGSDSLVATVRSYRPGDEVEVTYLRDGDEETTTVTLESDAESSNG
jgi:putative serine protease PepD